MTIKKKKKSELFPQILLRICYELFIGNLLSSHSVYWRNKVNVCIKYFMAVMISFIKSKLWFQANLCRYYNTRFAAWASVHLDSLETLGIACDRGPRNSTFHLGCASQCLNRTVLHVLQIYESLFPINLHLSETKCYSPSRRYNWCPPSLRPFYSLFSEINSSSYHFKEQKPELQKHSSLLCKGRLHGLCLTTSPDQTHIQFYWIPTVCQNCEIHAEIPNTERIQALPWLPKFSAQEGYKQVNLQFYHISRHTWSLPRTATKINHSAMYFVSQSTSGGLLALQSVNRLIHKQKVSLIDYIWKSLGKKDPLLQDFSSACVGTCILCLSNRGWLSPNSNPPENLLL